MIRDALAMDWHSLGPIAAILAAAIALVVVLRRFMAARLSQSMPSIPEGVPTPASRGVPLTAEEQEYLDSSHITSGPPGRRP